MTERTKWEMIADRKRKKKENAAIRAGGGIDQSWRRYTYCRICGQKICVNNYSDRKVRLPKMRGVIVCPWCQHHGGEFVVRMYKLVKKIAADPDQSTLVLEQDWIGKAMKILEHSPETRRQRASDRRSRKEASQEEGS